MYSKSVFPVFLVGMALALPISFPTAASAAPRLIISDDQDMRPIDHRWREDAPEWRHGHRWAWGHRRHWDHYHHWD